MDKKSILFEYENKQVMLEEISTMLWYIYEDYYGIKESDLYTKANNYDRLRVYLFNLQNQLNNLQDEMLDYFNKTFEELKREEKQNVKFIPINK